MNIIIIEDEALIAEELQEQINNYDESIKVLAVLKSVEEARSYLQKHPQPDLFFSDIQLPDGLSFEIFKTVETSCPVIFCTAYDDYALEAFKANGVDYILKPFDEEDIFQTLDKYQQLTSNGHTTLYQKQQQAIEQVLTPTQMSHFLIEKGDQIIPVKVDDVVLVHYQEGVSFLYTDKGTRYPYPRALDGIMERLGGEFYRLNRQAIIQRKGISKVSKYFGRKLLVQPTVECSEQLLVSKAGASAFLEWLAY
ncbi:LytTR family DNA-binding domain-containing protein [Persicobacter psychrovividus]|uniref:DNA-binding response regulator n=1 Tax=Persicobacter psychrovividus TaxID=387638 RepID=A0ABM7VC88_9BACT|nr:DNA-binding response regulator [Persicobacter psychrovividus]